MNPPKIDFPESWRVLATGITSIHGWPIFQALMHNLPQKRLLGVRPPKMEVPDDSNVYPLCITDVQSLKTLRKQFNPTHIVHCAGVCDLDVCEERPNWAHAINVQGAKAVVETFGDLPILYVSTDLVFSGIDPPPSGYTENQAPDPVSVAGRTFVLAEKQIQMAAKHCIIRIALPLGDSIGGQKGAVDWIENRFKRNLRVTLFYDEYRSCVSCEEVATVALRTLKHNLTGLYHFGGPKPWSLYEIGVYVLNRNDYDPTLLNGMLRHEEKNGPPRIGDVSLNSTRLNRALISIQE